MKITSFVTAATLLSSLNPEVGEAKRYYVGENQVRCTETEGGMRLYANNLELSCVKANHAISHPDSSHAFRLSGARHGQPSGKVTIELISSSRKARELRGGGIPCFVKGAELEEAQKLQATMRKELLCKLDPDVSIEVKNRGGLFPDFDVKVNGRKKRCEFNSRFSGEERKIMDRVKNVRTYDMDVSYTEQRTDDDPLMRVTGWQYNPNV